MLNTKKLTDSLVAHQLLCGRMVWRELPLGSVFLGADARVDVFTLNKSFVKSDPVVYEVKTSRGDFQIDVRTEKYKKYYPFCTRLYWAMEEGLIETKEIPSGTGLIRLGEHGWQVIKSPRYRQCVLDKEMYLKLLMKEFAEMNGSRELKAEDCKKQIILHQIYRKTGKEVARDLTFATRVIDEAKDICVKLNEALGEEKADLETGLWRAQKDIERILAQRRYLPHALELAKIAMEMFDGNMFAYGKADQLRKLADKMDKGKI